MNKVDEFIPLQVDDEKVRQIITKIRKSLKSFSVSSGKAFVLPPREELFSSKYHISYLELRKEGLAIEKLIKDAEEQENQTENSNIIPKYINPHYLDGRFSIFSCHSPFRTNINHIQFDLSLKYGQIVAVHNDPNDIFLGMIATKLNDDVYRVFDLSDDFMFTICTSNQFCPFPVILPKVLDSSNSFSAGDKVIAFSTESCQERKFQIRIGEIVDLFTNDETQEENYNVKFSDGSIAAIEPQFLTKVDSPFTNENDQAEVLKQEYIANGIDPIVMIDPKEVRKFKSANAKKKRDMKKKAAEVSENSNKQADKQEDLDTNLPSPANKKKDKKKASPTEIRHSPRNRPNSTRDSNPNLNVSSTVSVTPSTGKPSLTKENSREISGMPKKLPLAPDVHVNDHNGLSHLSTIHQNPRVAPPRVIQLQNIQMQQQMQQQYLYQQQLMMSHQQPHFVSPQPSKTAVSQSLTVSPAQYVPYQQISTLQIHQTQPPIFQQRMPTLGSVMRANSPSIDHSHEEEHLKAPDKPPENQSQKKSEPKDETKESLPSMQQNNDVQTQKSAQISTVPAPFLNHPHQIDQMVITALNVSPSKNEEKQNVVHVDPDVLKGENEASEIVQNININSISVPTEEVAPSTQKVQIENVLNNQNVLNAQNNPKEIEPVVPKNSITNDQNGPVANDPTENEVNVANVPTENETKSLDVQNETDLQNNTTENDQNFLHINDQGSQQESNQSDLHENDQIVQQENYEDVSNIPNLPAENEQNILQENIHMENSQNISSESHQSGPVENNVNIQNEEHDSLVSANNQNNQ